MCIETSLSELVQLLKVDPSGLDNHKETVINKHIAEMCAECPERLEKCKRFQWRLEQELAKHKNPTMRYNAMVSMLWNQVDEFQEALYMNKPSPQKDATIIKFKPKG